jgi:hypothetical protein
MEINLQSLFRLHVHSCTHWLRPSKPPPPPPAFGLIYEGAIGQQRKTTSLCDPLALYSLEILHRSILKGLNHKLGYKFKKIRWMILGLSKNLVVLNFSDDHLMSCPYCYFARLKDTPYRNESG